jgi:23S rRNA (cytidine1920-2'-O)/16S rRNA (cytidine1409-2'-O)-methyltransferase
VPPGGIVTDPSLQKKATTSVSQAATEAGLTILGTKPSRLPGAEGNQEHFIHARKAH